MSPEGPFLLGVKRKIIDFKRAGWDSGWDNVMLHPRSSTQQLAPEKWWFWKITVSTFLYLGFQVTFAGVPVCCLNLGRAQRNPEDFAEVDPFELHTWHLRSNVPKDLGWDIFFYDGRRERILGGESTSCLEFEGSPSF